MPLRNRYHVEIHESTARSVSSETSNVTSDLGDATSNWTAYRGLMPLFPRCSEQAYISDNPVYVMRRNPKTSLGLHVETGENRRHDADHSFAAFVHRGMVADSPCLRYQANSESTIVSTVKGAALHSK